MPISSKPSVRLLIIDQTHKAMLDLCLRSGHVLLIYVSMMPFEKLNDY